MMTPTQPPTEQPQPGLAAKIGAGLFALWGFLHLWVGYEGLRLYFASPANEQWKMFAGGSKAPLDQFVLPTDAVTAHVHANLILNFCLDVAGYGLLGMVVAWLVYTRTSWIAYFLGFFLIGLCDMSFLVLQVTSGTIALNLPTLSGPIIWFLAVLATPFGLPSLSRGLSREAI